MESPADLPEVAGAEPEPSATIIEEYQQWWRDAANTGARFRVQEEMFLGYQFREPFLHVRLVEDDAADGQTFDAVAAYLYFRGMGAILCREGWSADQKDNVDCLWLSYGGIVDYRMSDALILREPSSLGWDNPADKYHLTFESPDFSVLLPFQRYILQRALRQIGVEDPRVVLLIDHLGSRSLVFNIHTYFDTEDAMYISAFINSFLPRYYAQTVFTNHYDAAVYPLLPFEADDEKELRTLIQDAEMLEAHRREAARSEAALDADAIPSAGEQHWRELALRPKTRFQVELDNIVDGDYGTLYIVFRLVGPGAEGCSFALAALLGADEHCGAILCQSDWTGDDSMSGEDADSKRLVLRLGDLVDFLMTGKLERRRLLTEWWLYPMEYYKGRFSEPDVRLLPLHSRQAIMTRLSRLNISDPKVALQTLTDGKRLLHFSGFEAVGRNPEQNHALASQIQWCLPRHYTLHFLDTEEYMPWSLQPTRNTPSDEYFDLDEEKAEEEEDA